MGDGETLRDGVLGTGENESLEEERLTITEIAPIAASAEFYQGNYERMAKYVDIYHGQGARLQDPEFLEGKFAAVEAVQKLLSRGSSNSETGVTGLAAARRTYDMLFYSAVFCVHRGQYAA